MSNLVIKAENISKQYRLGLVGTGTVRDDFKRWWHSMRGKEDPFLKIGEANDRSVKGDSDYVWSLRDINFEINQGDSVGIIGRNGAGKSTLLKILSQVTQPTTGKIYTKGRIASLLEVGTGFHPEMTGRENIFLNGAILGMRKAEIQRKLDEIIDFSGVERYIDTPVKRYSSGMYVRLAFAVAAHLESEILIVDEVLAVGDAEFQKKCLGKMNDVQSKEGRTVLFVSHNMDAIRSLCKSSILLNNGIIQSYGDSNLIINEYLEMNHQHEIKASYKNHSPQGELCLASASISQNSQERYDIENKEFMINLEVLSNTSIPFTAEFVIKNANGSPLFFVPSGLGQNILFSYSDKFLAKIEAIINLPFLASGDYFIDVILGYSGIKVVEHVESALKFSINKAYVKETGFLFADHQNVGSILLNTPENITFKAVKYT